MKKRGYSLIEMIVYISILSLVFVLVVNTLLIIVRSYNTFKLSSDINRSASTFLERVVREVRFAESIDLSQSNFDSHPGELVLNTRDESNSLEKISFYLEDNLIKLSRDSVLIGPLTDSSLEISNLVFKNVSGTSSEAVRIEVSIQGTKGSKTKTENFFTTTLLRGAY